MSNYTSEFFDTKTSEEMIGFLFEKKLIKREVDCNYCSLQMILKQDKKSPEGFSWRCLNTKCCHYKTVQSIRAGSFFATFGTPIKSIIKCIYYYTKLPRRQDIKQLSGMSKTFIQKLTNLLICKIEEFFVANQITLGGPGVVIQVDETKVNFNVKSHRGDAPTNPCWVITIVDTSQKPSKEYAEIVERRDARTLFEAINRVVLPGSIIYTDEWQAYKAIGRSNVYSHFTVTHKYHFVNTETGVHIQNAESFNNKIKYKIKMLRGVLGNFRKSFLQEFLFFDWHKQNALEKIFELLEV